MSTVQEPRQQVTRVHPLAECEKCPLYGNGFALSDGPDDADVIVVSRSPAHGDTIVGKPFSGPSGKLLDHLLRMHGGDRKHTFVTNVVLCRADKPSPDAINACKPRLDFELNRIKARRVIAAGAEAVEALAPGNTVKGARGQRLATEDGRTLVATFNPAAALHDDVVFPDLVKDFKRALGEPKPPNFPTVTWTEDAAYAIDLLRQVKSGAQSNMGFVAADIESTGLRATSRVLSVGFSYEPGSAIVIGGTALTDGVSFRELKRLLESTGLIFIWHNGKFDVKLLRNAGINARIDDDTMLLSYLLDERPGVHSLDYMVADVLDWPLYESESVKKGKKSGFEDFEDWPALYEYNGFDCVGSFRIFEELSPRVVEERVDGIYRDLLIPASNVFADVEAYGVIYDVEKAEKVRDEEILPKIAEANFKAECASGETINLNSWKQCQKYFYEICGEDDPRVNRKVDYSTDDASRKALIKTTQNKNLREFLEAMSEFKRLDKLRSTYLDGLIKRVDADGRLRADFLLHGTESGRTSGRKPNLQNQPRGKIIRQLYVAPAGSVIMQADYSQCEIRTMAMESGDETMKKIYREGRDFHSETASFHFGEDFTKENRDQSKNMNFGVFYGQSPSSFAEMYDISLKTAQEFVGSIHKMFPRYWQWVNEVHRKILDEGELTSSFGRKRRFHLITDNNRDHVLKEGVNFMIQSPASDFHLHSAVILHDLLKDVGSHILIIVHDSIVFEVPLRAIEFTKKVVREVMESVPRKKLGWTDIPFKIDIGVGPSWGEVENA